VDSLNLRSSSWSNTTYKVEIIFFDLFSDNMKKIVNGEEPYLIVICVVVDTV
jgi:hypothetical protein